MTTADHLDPRLADRVAGPRDAVDDDTAAGEAPAVAAPGDEADGRDPVLVDWPRAGRRLGRSALLLAVLAVLGWLVTSLVTGQWRGGVLGNWMGLALAGMLLVELWVVGGSALRGMLRAGEEGHRLARQDVGILPPQLRRRR